MARIRTINFLPEIFQTPFNKQVLGATLDQLVNQPNLQKIQGYIGSRFGYGINSNDSYVPEFDKIRTDYQLEPGVVFTKPDQSVAKDFITYPGILDAIKNKSNIDQNQSDLFTSEFYSWNSFVDLDKLVNYSEYYWLPDGPPVVTIAASYVYKDLVYIVNSVPDSYDIRLSTSNSGSNNPTLTLLRGGSYEFQVSQDSQFWIQAEPGVSGYSIKQPNIPTREIFGVENNGANQGSVIFTVPAADAQNEYDFPVNNIVDLVCTTPFNQIEGKRLSEIGNIDGVTGLEGLRVVFYDTGILNEIGYYNTFFDEKQYDTNDSLFGQQTTPLTIGSTFAYSGSWDENSPAAQSWDENSPLEVDWDMYSGYLRVSSGTTSSLKVNSSVTFTGSTFGNIISGKVYYIRSIINSTDFTISESLSGPPVSLITATGTMTATIGEGLYEDGKYTTVNNNYYKITYVNYSSDPVIRLIPDGTINTNEKITPTLGVIYNNRPLYKDVNGNISLIPYISAPLTTLYYQDGTTPDKVGIIKIIESNTNNVLDVETDVLGKKYYTSPNGIKFTNGLKVNFDGDVVPTSYLSGQYYVEGVGKSIELIPVSDLIAPEKFTQGEYNTFDGTGWDVLNWELSLYIPVDKDYITIARNSLSKNAWARSNRWFHLDVIKNTASYNLNPDTLNLASGNNKAKRPIIEFYPNLKLFNSGSSSRKPIDFFDFKNTNSLDSVPNSLVYYPDTEVYSDNTGTINSVSNGTSTTLTIPKSSVTGTLLSYMYIGDNFKVLPNNSQVTDISDDDTTYTLTITWAGNHTLSTTHDVSIVADIIPVNNYNLFPGSRIVFAVDSNSEVRNKIYQAEYSTLTAGGDSVITLTVAGDGVLENGVELFALRGYNNQGKSYYYDGTEWLAAQEKNTVNQAPLFDIFDNNGMSFSDNDIYTGTSFTGTKLFSYGTGSGTADTALGFPLRYSNVNNIGDISFDVSFNKDTFNYVQNGNPIVKSINMGYVHNFTSLTTYERLLGWEKAIAPSIQYQIFDFDFDVDNPSLAYTCDVMPLPNVQDNWPSVKVFYNNVYKEEGIDYTYTTTDSSTVINLITTPTESTKIQVLINSDQISNVAYYQVPWNLSKNPLNGDLQDINIGDVRIHYQDIFINSPITTGTIFGDNNYRDCGDLNHYGSVIVQNSASLALPGIFLRYQDYSLVDALLYNSREYTKYKQNIVYTVQNTSYEQTFTPSKILDDALEQITSSKNQINSFFWSDMLPGKSPYISNTYTFNNNLDHTRYTLSKIYDFNYASYDGILVYLLRNGYEYLLVRNKDYTIDDMSAHVILTIPLLNHDQIVVKEYNQTYGSYVPNTPTKLGLYPAFEPKVVLDTNYLVPTYFIVGHDGSYTKLYGEYDEANEVLIDFRDQALLEFERRVYNNIKLSTPIPIREYDVVPGYFRNNNKYLSYDTFKELYTPSFLDWIGQNRLDYKSQYFSKTNEFTYNYSNSSNKLDNNPIPSGYWRGVYQYFYDTTAPNVTPWEMLGFSIKPTWWDDRYGPAPYTSENLILWNDLELGYVYNDGNPYTISKLARPGLTKIIPVDTNGNLVSPFVSIVGNYQMKSFQSDWMVGDMGPVELSYRRSSTWPFDLVRLFAVTKPAELYNLAVDFDNYKYNTEFDQYLYNDISHLRLDQIEVYGDGTPATSYINWIVDYVKQHGIDATAQITSLLKNIDVRLIYRLGGFSDKTLVNFFVEKANPTTNTNSLLIPNESLNILLYDNVPSDKINYSSVIVQQNDGYFTVYGNSQKFAYFETVTPIFNGKYTNLTVVDETVKLANDYSNLKQLVPYGTKFYNVQDVCQFLMNYGNSLIKKGMVFDKSLNGLVIDWQQMVLELMYWSQQGWEAGSIVNLNPAATDLTINNANKVVQPLTIKNQNYILNQNLYPVELKDLCVDRDDTNFHVHTLNQGDSLSYGQFDLSSIEHGIVFDNTTLFNDVIYNLITGLKQDRMIVRGSRTADWNGTVNALGFILSQDNIKDWSNSEKYTKGQIVTYKNKYYVAQRIIAPSNDFQSLYWKEIQYSDIQIGMLANPANRAYESTLYYDIHQANLHQDADLLSFSLIGYRPRDYLTLIDLSDISQVQVYQNLIRNKGTNNAIDMFVGANLPQGPIDYKTYENWAIQTGSFGGLLNENFVEFRINQALMTGDPSIVSLLDSVKTEGSMQEVPIWQLYNYNTKIDSANILTTLDGYPEQVLYPSAGFVNYSDVKMASYFYSGLPFAVDTYNKTVPINNFYVGEYMWLANFKERWEVFGWKSIGQVFTVKNNANQTATITFDRDHNLIKNDPVAIANFSITVDGYYIVTDIVNLREVIINLNITNPNNNNVLQGKGLGFSFQSHRVSNPADIANMDLIENDFIKNRVWVDNNVDGNWAVYEKSINFDKIAELKNNNLTTFGTSVAYTDNAGYFVGDAGAGEVYRYKYDSNTNTFIPVEILTGSNSFGTSIAHANNFYAISQPTSSPRVNIYVLNNSVLTNQLTSVVQAITALDGSTDWGDKITFSDDGNFLFISALDLGKVYVYQKQNIDINSGNFNIGDVYTIKTVGDTDFKSIGAIDNKVGITFVATGIGSGTGVATLNTYIHTNTITGSSSDGYGNSISTSYRGNRLLVGSPYYDGTVTNWGKADLYLRSEQNFIAPYNSVSYQKFNFDLAWTPNNIAGVTGSAVNSNAITLSSVTNITVNTPIMFIGNTDSYNDFKNTGISPLVVYYVQSVVGSTIKLKSSRNNNTVLTFTNATSLNFTAYAQTNQMFVYVNGYSVQDNNYGVANNRFYWLSDLNAGDIVSISDNYFYKVQTFNSDYNDRIDINFGISVDMNTSGNDIVVGSPFEVNDNNVEGAVYSFVNGGAKYGTIIGTSACNITTNRTILLNGYSLTLTPGNARSVATQINSNNLINIQAMATSDNKLVIELIDKSLSPANEMLSLTVFGDSVLTELGINLFTKTQVITTPHEVGRTAFGTNVKINNRNSLLISAPTSTRYEGTFFDFIDDENFDNDTLFDNNATQFVDTYENAGSVFLFEYLANYQESLNNPGKYVYAQNVNDDTLDYGNNPNYGNSLEFVDNKIMIGYQNFDTVATGGKVLVFVSPNSMTDWVEYRKPVNIVDTSKINNVQLFSAKTNQTLSSLDYVDPLQNKLLGIARENIDYVSATDPANYNVNYLPQSGMLWGAEHVGKIWFDTNNVRWFNYHQNDLVYNSRHWGQVFPGSDVAVYTWVESDVTPNNYQGPGTVYDENQYNINSMLNSSGIVVPTYYFWVRNTNTIYSNKGKTLSDNIIEGYITNPNNSGVPLVAFLLPNTFSMYNCGSFFDGTDTIFHIGYNNNTGDDVAHNEYSLIRENFADDFLPGFPLKNMNAVGNPTSLYSKFLDSLSGCDTNGQVVPNPFLPENTKQGILNTPRQSFFYNRNLALKNYLDYCNNILKQYPIIELREELSFLFVKDQFYDTTNYWQYINWWADGYDNSTKTSVQVSVYADLASLDNTKEGTLAKVEKNGSGKFEVYRNDGNGVWTRVSLENGTLNFNSYLYDFVNAKIGYSGNFFDTDPYDSFPSSETRNIIRALNEQIFIQDFLVYRNNSLILLFNYVQSETIESENYLPWLTKTSMVDVSHNVRELKPYRVYKNDDQTFLNNFINEAKPYHVVIKDFLFKYTGIENYEGNFTDFDIPAKYNQKYGKFISPQMTYAEHPSNENEYTYNNSLWQTDLYKEWYENYGLSLGNPVYSNGTIINYVGQPNYHITTLKSYLTLGTRSLYVDNASGFPTNGVIKIDDEYIGYSTVDRDNNILSGLSRGLNSTNISNHYPNTPIYIDLPAALLLYGGRLYNNPPKITAKIDTSMFPAPMVEASFTPVMALDVVTDIKITNPGKGYAVTPELIIEPALSITFDNTMIISKLNNLRLYAPDLRSGDLVQFKNGDGAGVGNLKDGGWYYVGVLETTPATIIALYNNYVDSVSGTIHGIPVYDIGTSTGMTLNLGARAIAIPQATPVRENIMRLRYDRTSYQSHISDWEKGNFYGAFYAGSYHNTDKQASTHITLESTSPDINSIRASSNDVVFEIVDAVDEKTLVWSSYNRIVSKTLVTDSIIRLAPQDGNNPDLSQMELNASGTTIGFYKNMPVKFEGTACDSNISIGTTYYVHSIINEVDFTISTSIDGTVLSLTGGIATIPMTCITGAYDGKVVLTANYPNLLQATEAKSDINSITIPISLIGTGGTTTFTPRTILWFTATNPGESMFGNLIENQVYYVNTIIDEKTFTLSQIDINVATNIQDRPFTDTVVTPLYKANVTQTISLGNAIVLDSAVEFTEKDPVIFTGTTFGNIIAGKLYYVLQKLSPTQITISENINGNVLTLIDSSGSCVANNQKNAVKLSTSTGTMTANVSLPVSPGQVNGQAFEFYKTSNLIPNIGNTTYTITDTLHKNVYATITGVNRLALDDTSWLYKNMPVQLRTSIGGLSSSTTYYVKDYTGGADPADSSKTLGPITVVCDSTSSTGNKIHCNTDYDTSSLYLGMPIVFSGVGLGNIVVDEAYVVYSIIDSKNFTISTDGSTVVVLKNDTGVMTGTGIPYITLSSTPNGSTLAITSTAVVTNPIKLDQTILTYPVFTLSYILGGYRAIITDGGSGFAITNQIVIPGTVLGGKNTTNDITLEVNTIDSSGSITDVIVSGVVPIPTQTYYLKIRGNKQFEVYLDKALSVPVKFDDFTYKGFASTLATAVTASNDRITVSDSSIFNLYDPVVFTGDIFSSDINIAQTYYVKSIVSGTAITISTVPNGTTLNISSDASGSMNIAKSGSYMFLPEPFFFGASIIRFNNRLYNCLVSNNDNEFVIGKWELIDSGDPRINAMDRVIGYYQPTRNMPGRDLTQLYDGVTYPNSIYKGNSFSPSLQYDLDTKLKDLEFYPTNVELTSVVYNNGYYASANLLNYSAIVYSMDGVNWIDAKLATSNINFTDMLYANGVYLITSTNPFTPIYRSNNGMDWSTNGSFTPWGSVAWDTENYDSTSLSIAQLSLEAVSYFNGLYIAVGDSIIYSLDTYDWVETKTYPVNKNFQLYDIAPASTGNFTGVVAVGTGSVSVVTNDITITNPTNLITYSYDGKNYNDLDPITDYELYTVASSDTLIIAAGESGIIYSSSDAINWQGHNEFFVSSFNPTNGIMNISPVLISVGTPLTFSQPFSSIDTTTTYYVESIISDTLITISLTDSGSVYTGSVNAGSFMIGSPYTIQSLGTTDWNSIGYIGTPAVGGTFNATGVGSGNGTAYAISNVLPGTKGYGYDNLSIWSITYNNNVWVLVGEQGKIQTSTDGTIWITRTSNTLESLNNVTYVSSLDQFVVVGDNNTILVSNDNGVTWDDVSLFSVNPAKHVVKGDEFKYGYGPEELVPGVIRDNMMMTVRTRPGVNWDSAVYQHTGFTAVSKEFTPITDLQKVYNFDGITQYPARVIVQKIDSTSGLGTTLYEGIDYTVEWVYKNIILTTPLTLTPLEKLRVDVYEVGNGNQLTSSNTDIDPIRVNTVTGFNEIYTNCNFTGTIFQGSGVVQPNTYESSILATQTESISNRITLDNVAGLNIGAPITFSGIVFGSIISNTTYYIKTVSNATNTITVSVTYDVNTGTSGPTVPLTDDTGTMYLNLSVGSEIPWTAPIIYNNGVKLVQGYSSNIIETISGSNYIITDSTAGMVPNCKIIFSNTAFGNLNPLTTYYVKTIVNFKTFTVSATPGGSEVILTDTLGVATYITFDYSFGIQSNGINATIIFASNTLTNDNNYLNYTLFGETTPAQYGYSIPETQMFTGDGSTTVFTVANNVGGTNDTNGIVEIDGLRQTSTAYTIDFITNTLTFTSAPVNDSKIAVTTFNDTNQQYLHTQYGDTVSVSKITYVNNTVSPAIAVGQATGTSSTNNQITVNSTTNFVAGQRIEFKGTSFGSVATDGTVYYIKQVVDSTHITIQDYLGNQIVLTTDIGFMSVTVGGLPAVMITVNSDPTWINNTKIRIDGLGGSTELNGQIFYVRKVTPTTYELYQNSYSSSFGYVNVPQTVASKFTSAGYTWKYGSIRLKTATISQSYNVSPTFAVSTLVVDSTADLVQGTPIYLSTITNKNGDSLIGGLKQGTVYYIKTIYSETEFSVSATQYGDSIVLTDQTATIILTQFSQQYVDRLYITINGKRVPSSSLRIYDYNELGILTAVSSSDAVIMTNMVPTSTPNQGTYINIVDEQGNPTILCVPAEARTFVTYDLYPLSTELKIDDVTAVVNSISLAATASLTDGYFVVGLKGNKQYITGVRIKNVSTGLYIDRSQYQILLQDNYPTVRIDPGSYISVNDVLDITVFEGNKIYVDGEIIEFTEIDYQNNKLLDIRRGAEGTGAKNVIRKYSEVFGMIPENILDPVYYNQLWNSFTYDSVNGDPLQISTTVPAKFLDVDNS